MTDCRTAFLFPGLDGMQRAVDFRRMLALPGFAARWRTVAVEFARDPSLRAFEKAFADRVARPLPGVTDWRWPALMVAAMQLAAAEELEHRGERADIVVGYSIGELARSLHAGAAPFAAAITFARALGPVAGTGGTTVLAFTVDASDAAAAIRRLGPLAPLCSRLSDRILAVPVETTREAEVRAALSGPGRRLFELAPCGLHGPLQRPLARRLRLALESTALRPLRVPAFSSQTQRVVESTDELRRELADNVATPFDFAAAIRTLHREHGITRFVDLGPGAHACHFVQHSGLPVEAVSALDLLPTAR